MSKALALGAKTWESRKQDCVLFEMLDTESSCALNNPELSLRAAKIAVMLFNAFPEGFDDGVALRVALRRGMVGWIEKLFTRIGPHSKPSLKGLTWQGRIYELAGDLIHARTAQTIDPKLINEFALIVATQGPREISQLFYAKGDLGAEIFRLSWDQAKSRLSEKECDIILSSAARSAADGNIDNFEPELWAELAQRASVQGRWLPGALMRNNPHWAKVSSGMKLDVLKGEPRVDAIYRSAERECLQKEYGGLSAGPVPAWAPEVQWLEVLRGARPSEAEAAADRWAPELVRRENWQPPSADEFNRMRALVLDEMLVSVEFKKAMNLVERHCVNTKNMPGLQARIQASEIGRELGEKKKNATEDEVAVPRPRPRL